MSLTRRCRPITAAKHTSIQAKIAVAKQIILYETAKIRTTTTVEGTYHPFGTCMEGFEVVCKVSHTLCWPYQPKPSLRAPKLRAASGACLDRRMGVWCRKDVNASLQRPSSIIQGHIQRILRGWGCLRVPDPPPLPHNSGRACLTLGQNFCG